VVRQLTQRTGKADPPLPLSFSPVKKFFEKNQNNVIPETGCLRC
jgi:hypothetical protein